MDDWITVTGGRWLHVAIFDSDKDLDAYVGACGPDLARHGDAAFLRLYPGEWCIGYADSKFSQADESQIHLVPPDPSQCCGILFFSLDNRKPSVVAHEALHATLWLNKLSRGRKVLNYADYDVEEDVAFLLEQITEGSLVALDRAASEFRRRKATIAA